MLETGTGGYPAHHPLETGIPAYTDEFDLDIRLGAAGGKKPRDDGEDTDDGFTCVADCNGGGTDGCGSDIDCGGTKIECQTEGRCPTEAKTCVNTECKQATCFTCETKCNQQTCTCQTKCNQHTCAATCETCNTQCKEQTCHTCATECQPHTCSGQTCVRCQTP